MKTFAMYSYKGGAGRTVSTANIAYVLAKEENKKVLLVDCDLDGAGMQYVLQNKYSPTVFAVQDIFSDTSKGKWDEELLQKFAAEVTDTNGNLWFIAARPATEDDVTYNKNLLKKRWRPMLSFLKTKKDFDFIIIDSASGLQGIAAFSLVVSDVIVTFMRWSNQFIDGTLSTVKRIYDGARIILLVPSAVPDISDNKNFNVVMSRRKIRVEAELEGKVDILGDGIPESMLLKWQETILCDEKSLSKNDEEVLEAYRMVAKKMVKML